jgi:hypothetical protein
VAVCCWCQSSLVEAEGAWWCGGSDGCRARQCEFALAATDKKTKARRWLYVPTPKQVEFHRRVRQVRRVLYGGQAGPGKSHALRWGLYRDCLTIPNLNCLLLRRTYQQLEQTHLGEMVREQGLVGGVYTSGDKVMRFPNGSLIRAGHCENTTDAQNYLSTEYDRIAFDELVTFDQGPALEIMSRARTSKPQVKASGDAQVWAGTNPGGRGSLWVREFFIDHTVDRSQFPRYEPERYGFVEATLDDNPYISEQYRVDLEDLPEMRKRQLLYGDWFAFEGQFFSEVTARTHAATVEMPSGVEWSAGMDWGYSAPGWIGFFAHLPDGHYHLAKEYRFKGQTAESVGKEIRKVLNGLGEPKLRYIAADPAMWSKTGAGRGESIAETLLRLRLPLRKGDNDRFNGALRVRELLRDDGTGTPFLTIAADGCPYWWRTIPALVSDDHDPEDVDTTMDDHAYDGTRYWAMSRPSPTRVMKDDAPKPGTWGFETARQDALATQGAMVIA